MNTLKMKNFQALSNEDMKNIEGGFVPLIIYGVYVSANVVAGAAGVAAGGTIWWLSH